MIIVFILVNSKLRRNYLADISVFLPFIASLTCRRIKTWAICHLIAGGILCLWQINYQASGWVTHHVSDIWAKSSAFNEDAKYAVWPMGGAWLCTHLWEHYQYLLDKVRNRYDLMLLAHINIFTTSSYFANIVWLQRLNVVRVLCYHIVILLLCNLSSIHYYLDTHIIMGFCNTGMFSETIFLVKTVSRMSQCSYSSIIWHFTVLKFLLFFYASFRTFWRTLHIHCWKDARCFWLIGWLRDLEVFWKQTPLLLPSMFSLLQGLVVSKLV